MIVRFQAKLLSEMLEIFPVVAVIGPRQVGKSTLVTMPSIGEGREYLSMDDINLRSVAESDPKGFLGRPGPVTVDEVQLVPGLLREIKRLVDHDRQAGRFLLTGSADLDHYADLSEVLAGRVGVLRLPPVTLSEETGATGWRSWLRAEDVGELDRVFSGKSGQVFDFSRILRGGFPLSIAAGSARARQLWFESFRMTYLERDLRRISDISHLAEFNRLMQLTASVTGNLLNQAHLARDAGMSPVTAGRYLSVLEASLLVHRMVPFFANIGKRMVKSPKLYWVDTGLCAYLLGIEDVEDLERKSMLRGCLFETFVMMEVMSLLAVESPSSRLYHVRSHDQLEVDGLIQHGPREILFEIKASRTVGSGDASSLEKWIRLRGKGGFGIVIYAGEDYLHLSDKVRAVPATVLFGQSKGS